MKVYVQFLVWNDRRYLPDLFESLEAQTYKDFTVRVLDNGSTDETLAYLQEHYPHAIVGRSAKNQGFAAGHNQLLRFTLEHMQGASEDPFLLLMNSDMILDVSLIENLAQALEADPKLGAVQPKLYRAFGEQRTDEMIEGTVKSDILDTTGLRLNRDWRMSDRGAGELDKGQYDDKADIVAPTGTMAMFRLSALKDILMNGEWFDGDFFAYREDCDFGLRFRKLGWETRYIPTAIAWHYRGMYGSEKQSAWQRLRNRMNQRPFFAALSTRNQLFVLLKHLTFFDALRYGIWIFPAEVARVLFGFIFEPMTRKRLITMWPLIPKMLRCRKEIRKRQATPDAVIRSYVGR